MIKSGTTLSRMANGRITLKSDGIHNTSFPSQLINMPNKLVLYYTKLERLAMYKHSSLSGPFISNEENEVL
jgi:hypothetical protein